MNVLIHQSLIIYIFVLIYGVHTLSVVIGGNTGGLIGENGTEIECVFPQLDISHVSFMAFNKSSITSELIATYRLNRPPALNPKGQYLKGRVTLTPSPITQSSRNAVMTFNKLMCIDDKSYQCNVNYYDSGNVLRNINSNNILSITVQVPPSKPESISLDLTPADSSVTTTNHMDPSTPLPSTGVTLNTNNTVSASTIENQNTTTAFNHSTIQTSGHNITTSTPSTNTVPSDTTYETTTSSTQQTIKEKVIAEGDNVTVVCTGEVGNPPAEHFFQKYSIGHILSKTYTPTETLTSEISENCSYYRTSNLTFQVTAEDNNAVIRCVVNSSMASTDMYIETKRIEVYYDVPTTQSSSTCSSSCVEKKEGKSKGNFDDIPTTQSSSNCRSACVDKKEENSTEKFGLVAYIVGAVVAVIVVIIVIIACTYRRRKNKSPTFTNVSNSFSNPKPVTEPRTGDYDYIAVEDDPPKAKSSNNGLEVEDIKKQNEEYLKKQEEEEKKKNNSNTPPQPAVYAQVNETSKLKNKQKTETLEKPDKQEEDPYAETQEGVYDQTGNPRHKENKDTEQYDVSSNSSKQNSNGDNKLSIQTSQVGSYANQGFEKDESRKVATVSPTVRSSSGSQNDEQTNSNRNSQSKKGYENIIGTDQTGISEEESSHRTAL